MLPTHQDPTEPPRAPGAHGGKLRHRKAKGCGGTHLRPASSCRSKDQASTRARQDPDVHVPVMPRALEADVPDIFRLCPRLRVSSPHFQYRGSPWGSNSPPPAGRPDLPSCWVGFDPTPSTSGRGGHQVRAYRKGCPFSSFYLYTYLLDSRIFIFSCGFNPMPSLL